MKNFKKKITSGKLYKIYITYYTNSLRDKMAPDKRCLCEKYNNKIGTKSNANEFYL